MGERRQCKVADETGFIFKLVAEIGACPQSRIVFAVVHETGAVEIRVAVKREIEVAKGAFAARVHDPVDILANVVVFVAAEAVSPLAGCSQFEIRVSEEVVLPRKLIAVRRQILTPVEIEEGLDPAALVGVPRTQAECRL